MIITQEDLGLGEETYELCNNAACGYLGQGRYEEALEKLKQAEGWLLGLFYYDILFFRKLISFYSQMSKMNMTNSVIK